MAKVFWKGSGKIAGTLMYIESCVKGSPGSKIFYTPYSGHWSTFNHVLLTILPITFDAHSSLPSFIVISHHEKSSNLKLFRIKNWASRKICCLQSLPGTFEVSKFDLIIIISCKKQAQRQTEISSHTKSTKTQN